MGNTGAMNAGGLLSPLSVAEKISAQLCSLCWPLSGA